MPEGMGYLAGLYWELKRTSDPLTWQENGRLDADDASADRTGRGPGIDEDGRYSLPSDE